jgi:hypothetical protein
VAYIQKQLESVYGEENLKKRREECGGEELHSCMCSAYVLISHGGYSETGECGERDGVWRWWRRTKFLSVFCTCANVT